MHLGAYQLSILSFSSSKKIFGKDISLCRWSDFPEKEDESREKQNKEKKFGQKGTFFEKMSETLFVSTSPGDSDKNIFMKKSEITFLEGAETFGQSEV